VTETFHDVASYHMLHADKQADGTFALTANSLEGRTLPDEKAYAAARALLLDYFKYADIVQEAVKDAPRFNQNKVSIGCLVESAEEVILFKNSIESAHKAGISNFKFGVFTTNSAIYSDLNDIKVKVILIKEIAGAGTIGDADVGYQMRRHFIQAWLAFAVANIGNRMIWQSPGTIWIGSRPDDLVNSQPFVEALWSFKGRNDRRSAPFFCSFDFFVVTGAERPVHLMHEILLHFDLVLTWGSLDAVAAYRLSENNSRYEMYSLMNIIFDAIESFKKLN